jgi:mRNA interferase RelE/StbE
MTDRYEIRLTKEAAKDVDRLTPRMRKKLREILVNRVAVAPLSAKKLVGELQGFYSVRLSYKDRIVYSIDEEQHTVIVHRARTHYGD